MKKEEILKQLFDIIIAVGKGRPKAKADAAVDEFKKLMEKNGTESLVRDFIGQKLRELLSKKKMTPEEKELSSKLLCLALDLASDELTEAFKKHEDLKKFIKEKLVAVVKLLISLGLTALK